MNKTFCRYSDTRHADTMDMNAFIQDDFYINAHIEEENTLSKLSRNSTEDDAVQLEVLNPMKNINKYWSIEMENLVERSLKETSALETKQERKVKAYMQPMANFPRNAPSQILSVIEISESLKRRCNELEEVDGENITNNCEKLKPQNLDRQLFDEMEQQSQPRKLVKRISKEKSTWETRQERKVKAYMRSIKNVRPNLLRSGPTQILSVIEINDRVRRSYNELEVKLDRENITNGCEELKPQNLDRQLFDEMEQQSQPRKLVKRSSNETSAFEASQERKVKAYMQSMANVRPNFQRNAPSEIISVIEINDRARRIHNGLEVRLERENITFEGEILEPKSIAYECEKFKSTSSAEMQTYSCSRSYFCTNSDSLLRRRSICEICAKSKRMSSI